MNKVKLSLKLEEWPAADRRAYNAARDDDHDGSCHLGLAAFWSEAWNDDVIQRYGVWLHFLQRHGWLDHAASPLERVTEERVRQFRAEVSARVESVTLAGYFLGMSEALRVMVPDRKRPKFFRKMLRALLRTARPSRDEEHKLVAPSQLYRAGLRRMKRHYAAAATCKISALKFVDGLWMAMLVAKALRLKNFAGMLRSKNIKKNVLDQYEVKFAKVETKNKVRICAELPRTLTKYIDYYLTIVRPMLLRAEIGAPERETDAMWITTINTDMSPMTFYGRFCAATMKELGKRINPHFVRKIVATGIAYAAPESVKITPSLLDHTDPRTERESYRLAKSLMGSAQHIKLLEIRRRRALDGEET